MRSFFLMFVFLRMCDAGALIWMCGESERFSVYFVCSKCGISYHAT